MSTTTTLTEELQSVLGKARAIAAKAEEENRDFTAEERTEVEAHMKAAADLKAKVTTAKGDDELRSSIASFGDGIGLVDKDGKQTTAPAGFVVPAQRGKTIGEAFVESAEYKTFLSQFPEGRISEKARVQSLPVGFKSLFTGTGSDSGGALIVPEQSGIYEPLGRRPLTIRSLVNVRQTTSDAVEYVRQLARVNAAAAVPEATTAAGATANTTTGAMELPAGSGVKPEGGFTFERVTESVKTLAEWVPATKRGLSDASQLRGLIDQELRDDLKEVEEDEILSGDGTGEHLTGILETSGTQSQAYSAAVTDLNPLLETTYKGKTKVRTVGRSVPTGYVFNPADWETIHLARLAKNPANEALGGDQPTLHGLPVVESEAMPAGVGLVGDFRKAVLWDREQANVSVTDSHADFFIRNLVAVLAEERLAFGVIRPAAFVEIDLTA